jgi:hypothetical protein
MDVTQGEFHEVIAKPLAATREVVVMVTVCETGVEPLTENGAGAVQVAPVGVGVGPTQVSVTMVVLPAIGAKVNVTGVEAPAAAVNVVPPVGPVIVKSAGGVTPVAVAPVNIEV